MMFFIALVLVLVLAHFFAALPRPDWRVEGHWRPILCPTGRLDYLHGLSWSARRYRTQAERLRARGEGRAAQLYDDLAHIRALEERLESECFSQRVTVQQRPRVRAIVRVLA